MAAEVVRQLSLSPAQQTAATLAATERPPRDLYSLAQRYKGAAAISPSATATSQARQWKSGDKNSFWINDVEAHSYYTITATLQVVTDHAYFWVDDNTNLDLQALQKSANDFDQKVYPTDRQFFGSEWDPGVDNDPHVFILNTSLKGLRGYFSSADEYLQVVNPYSNEHEMIYIDAAPGDDAYAATLAHELQHMIHWNQNRTQDVWLNEGSAELAMAINGYSTGGVIPSFLDNQDVQLDAWSDTPAKSIPHYAASYLFFRYLTDHYGGYALMKDVLAAPFRGPEAISKALAARGYHDDFSSVFQRWIVANFANGRVQNAGDYSYATERFTVNTKSEAQPDGKWNADSVAQYGADYIRLQTGGKPAKLEFDGGPAILLTGAQPRSGSHIWWSNRGDDLNTSMTREIDLTTVNKATLRFSSWYDIERDYDYAYVSISTDGGQRWETLPASGTTAANPNGTNWGSGFTGESGTADGSGPAAWVDQQIDLSKYAGKKVLLRFEYVTDDGYNGEGLAIDNISIPEIGFTDDAEADAGWTTKGFVRVGNLLPQKFTVQVIHIGEGLTVEQVPMQPGNQGAVEVQPLPGDREVVLAIGAEAPTTTERANYRYRVSAP
jgi:immune inhibitor A